MREGARTRILRQYFHFVRPGAKRIAAATSDRRVDPIAFINANGKYVVVVKTTAGTAVGIEGLPPGAYRTSYTTQKEAVVGAEPTVSAGRTLTATIPARGVLTIWAP